MTNESPERPEDATASQAGADGGNPRNPEDPSRAVIGFPTGAVNALRIEVRRFPPGMSIVSVSKEAVDEVLAWIDRYVPRSIETVEERPLVGGVAILTVRAVDAQDAEFLDSLDLVRVNGRAFVPETPAIANDAAREAFLNLIADARTWEEQPDEAAIYYSLEFTHDSLEPLLDAFGIERRARTIMVDGQGFPGCETPAEAIDRVLTEEARWHEGEGVVAMKIGDPAGAFDPPGGSVIDPGAAGRAMAEAAGLKPPFVTKARPSPFPAAGSFHGVEIEPEPTDEAGRFPGDPGYAPRVDWPMDEMGGRE